MVTGSRIERQKYQYEQQKQAKKQKSKNSKEPNNKKSPWRWLKYFILTVLFVGTLTFAGAFALFTYYASNAPIVTEQEIIGQLPTKIFDRNGQLIKELGSQNRDLMTVEEIPKTLQDAVIAIEDARFFEHKGIDPIRILGALVANVKSREIAQGGSTITQQLIKLSVFSTDFKDQTIERKAQEAWLAVQLEQQYSKKEILAHYLNKMFYSNNTYGAKTAARLFFNKTLDQLTLSEAALLAGIPQAPSYYDPYAYPERAQERRDLVLDVMLERNMISKTEHDQAKAQNVQELLTPLSQGTLTDVDLVLDAYLDLVAQEVKDKMDLDIFTDGLDVYTNLDWDAQKHLFELVNQNSELFPNDTMQTAMSAIDATNGELVAVIGGRKQYVYLGLNRANIANRSIGSTMKPIADYGPAIEFLNFSTGTLVVDEPYKYTSGSELQNFDFDYKGKMTIREALTGSRNVPALKLLQAVGLDNAYTFLQKMDITLLNNDRHELVEANAIGGEISPIQLSAAYATIANYGVYHKPFTVKKIVTSAGTVKEFTTDSRQVMKDSTAYMLTDILKGVPGEFASAAKIEGLPQAGKTGTTNYTPDQLTQLGLTSSTYAAPDGWFVGFTPKYAIATWVGYDNPLESGNYLTLEETRIPQKLYANVMSYLMRNQPHSDWQMPSSVTQVAIVKYTDPIQKAATNNPNQSLELFVKGTEPTGQPVQAVEQPLVPTPTGFDANYDPETKTIKVVWDAVSESGTFELSVNGQVLYQGTDASATIPANEVKEYNLQLRFIKDGHSSDALVITITLKNDDHSNENSSENINEGHISLPNDTTSPNTEYNPTPPTRNDTHN